MTWATPVIVGGDFNTVYSIARTRELLRAGGFRNCFEQKVRTHRIWGMLAVRGPAQCDGATVVRGAEGSDHHPLAVRIRLDAYMPPRSYSDHLEYHDNFMNVVRMSPRIAAFGFRAAGSGGFRPSR